MKNLVVVDDVNGDICFVEAHPDEIGIPLDWLSNITGVNWNFWVRLQYISGIEREMIYVMVSALTGAEFAEREMQSLPPDNIAEFSRATICDPYHEWYGIAGNVQWVSGQNWMFKRDGFASEVLNRGQLYALG